MFSLKHTIKYLLRIPAFALPFFTCTFICATTLDINDFFPLDVDSQWSYSGTVTEKSNETEKWLDYKTRILEIEPVIFELNKKLIRLKKDKEKIETLIDKENIPQDTDMIIIASSLGIKKSDKIDINYEKKIFIMFYYVFYKNLPL